MKKFSVYIPWHCGILLKVEAQSKSDALNKAYEHYPTLCHACSKHVQLGEINDDYSPEVIEVVE